MTPPDFRASLDRLKLTQRGAAPMLGVDERTVRKWANGERGIPPTVVILLRIYEHDPRLTTLAKD